MVLSLAVIISICAVCVFIICAWSVYKLYRKKPSPSGEVYSNGLEYIPPDNPYSLI